MPVLAVGAFAAGIRADVGSGHALVRDRCASCHAVEPGALEGPVPEVPSFTAIAELPSTTASALHAFLATPHGDMPDIILKAGEIDAVISYILSLKK
jgi:mono/diheme cytochrome c family protein